MVKKTLICTGILLFSYAVFVANWAPKWWAAAQSPNHDNIIKAQNFIYSDQTPHFVIVGSSLSGLIKADSLPGTTNLAFGGLSIYDGLYVITHKAIPPKVVLIEMNMVFRNENKPFTSPLFSPLTYYPRKKIEALRAEKMPLAVLGKLTLKGIYSIKDIVRGRKPVPIIKLVSGTRELSKKMLNALYIEMFKLPDAKYTSNSVSELKRYVSMLEEKGIKVVFYEMPIDNQLEQLPLPVYIRKTFYENFPQSKYTYIARPQWDYCDTFDGQHLEGPQAIIYSQYLKEKIAGI